MADAFDKAQVVVGEVEVRLARPDERRRWDALMDQHHYLGFRQFAVRGLRHVAVWCGHWLALLGWQSGAFKCTPRLSQRGRRECRAQSVTRRCRHPRVRDDS